jgi:hypothetical protein
MTTHYRYFPRFGSFSNRYAKSVTRDEERRRHTRKPCTVPVDYAVDDHPLKGLIQNLSAGGALLSSGGGHFLAGQEISMSFLLPETGKPIRNQGRIAWSGQKSLGIRFKDMDTKAFEKELNHLKSAHEKAIDLDKTNVDTAGRARRKKVSWQPSTSPNVSGYRLYWAIGGQVDYDSPYIEVDDTTEVTLPDDIPSLFQQTGDIQLGVTAISQAGNESDMTKLNAFIDFRIPGPPQDFEMKNT